MDKRTKVADKVVDSRTSKPSFRHVLSVGSYTWESVVRAQFCVLIAAMRAISPRISPTRPTSLNSNKVSKGILQLCSTTCKLPLKDH